MVAAEGVAERTGDVLVQCTGGTPGTATTGNLNLMYPAAVTNRVTADGLASGITLAINDVPVPVTGRVAGRSLVFTGVSATVPPSGALALRVSGVRLNINQLSLPDQTPIQAYISTSLSSLALANNPVTVALPQRGLLASFSSTGLPCAGSPLPSTISVGNLFTAGTLFGSTRVTEGFGGAFQTGTRFMVRYTNLPAGTRLFVPDAVAGSDSAQPTAGGDLGLPASAGVYTPGALLLARVLYPDVNGAGGTILPPPSSGALGGASEVPVSNGAANVVYEVVDSNPVAAESAQWPTFIGLARTSTVTLANQAVSFAPVSADPAASVSAPVPRYAAVAPGSDCSALGDCSSNYFPKLQIIAAPMQFTSIQGGAVFQAPGYLPIQNAGGGIMPWVATLQFKNGDGWAFLENTSGINNGSVRVFITPQKLTPGKYEASVTVDAGERAGKQTFPVVLVVSPAPAVPNPPTPPTPTTPEPPAPPAPPKAAVSSAYNAADARMSRLAPGSLATLLGANFAGKQVAVTFDGVAAKLLFTSDSQINLLVPAELAGKTSAQVVVAVDGAAGVPFSVPLAAIAPGIFVNGVLNQDGSVNGDATPAPAGSVLQIFATGLPADGKGVVVKIHDRENLAPLYAGAAPGADGVQQVNVAIPGDLPGMPTEVVICAGQACSWPVKLVLR